MTITVRQAMMADKPRIVEIAGQIWEGHDYVPRVIDGWLSDPNGEVAAAEVDGAVAGFAHIAYPLPGYAWMEGIRTDPTLGNRGVAKAITEYLIDAARRRGCEVAELSTYIENFASLHIIETHGFERVAGFTALSVDQDGPAQARARAAARASERAEAVPPSEALAFIRGSAFLDIAQGYVPANWHFYPLDRGPDWVLSHLDPLIGIRRGGRLSALLAIAARPRDPGEISVSFLDGAPEDMAELARHVLYLAGDSYIEAVVPQWLGRTAPAFELFRDLGLEPWHGGEADIFAYRHTLHAPRPTHAGI